MKLIRFSIMIVMISCLVSCSTVEKQPNRLSKELKLIPEAGAYLMAQAQKLQDAGTDITVAVLDTVEDMPTRVLIEGPRNAVNDLMNFVNGLNTVNFDLNVHINRAFMLEIKRLTDTNVFVVVDLAETSPIQATITAEANLANRLKDFAENAVQKSFNASEVLTTLLLESAETLREKGHLIVVEVIEESAAIVVTATEATFEELNKMGD